jgi:hypothetical protein
MSKYTITHGSIAAIQYIKTDGQRDIHAIYQSENKLPEAYLVGDMSKDIWDILPLEVQSFVNRQFGIIFILPYESRQDFIDNSIPFEIEVKP